MVFKSRSFKIKLELLIQAACSSQVFYLLVLGLHCLVYSKLSKFQGFVCLVCCLIYKVLIASPSFSRQLIQYIILSTVCQELF